MAKYGTFALENGIKQHRERYENFTMSAHGKTYVVKYLGKGQWGIYIDYMVFNGTPIYAEITRDSRSDIIRKIKQRDYTFLQDTTANPTVFWVFETAKPEKAVEYKTLAQAEKVCNTLNKRAGYEKFQVTSFDRHYQKNPLNKVGNLVTFDIETVPYFKRLIFEKFRNSIYNDGGKIGIEKSKTLYGRKFAVIAFLKDVVKEMDNAGKEFFGSLDKAYSLDERRQRQIILDAIK